MGEKSAEPAVGRPIDEQEVSEQNCSTPTASHLAADAPGRMNQD